MIEHRTPYPRQPAPDLEVDVVGGGRWRLADQAPESFTMVVFYRGLHCPICSRYLADLAGRLDDFAERGVEVVAVSGDDRERAERTAEEWSVEGLTLGYGLPLEEARRWGLYISTSRGKSSTGVVEPEHFSEPGLFLVRPDGTLYFASVQTMPFARPDFGQILGGIDFVLEHDYPARGEVLDGELAEAGDVS